MKISAIVLGVLAVVLVAVSYFKQHELPVRGLKVTGKMLLMMAPMLIAAFVISGQIQVLLPRDLAGRWLGEKAGLKGMLIASAAGALTPGGPYVSLPIAVSLSKAGASLGCVVAYLVAWTMWGLNGLAFEISVLGPRLTLAKRLATLVFPLVAGMLVQLVVGARWAAPG